VQSGLHAPQHRAAELREFAERSRDALKLLDEAYTATRYLPKTYDEVEASRALSAAEDALKVADEAERRAFP